MTSRLETGNSCTFFYGAVTSRLGTGKSINFFYSVVLFWLTAACTRGLIGWLFCPNCRDWTGHYLEQMVELGHVRDDGELVRDVAVHHVLVQARGGQQGFLREHCSYRWVHLSYLWVQKNASDN